jgi:hypothetical protein
MTQDNDEHGPSVSEDERDDSYLGEAVTDDFVNRTDLGNAIDAVEAQFDHRMENVENAVSMSERYTDTAIRDSYDPIKEAKMWARTLLGGVALICVTFALFRMASHHEYETCVSKGLNATAESACVIPENLRKVEALEAEKEELAKAVARLQYEAKSAAEELKTVQGRLDLNDAYHDQFRKFIRDNFPVAWSTYVKD